VNLNSNPSNCVIIDVAAGLVFRDGKLLITQRRPHDHLGNLWEFPGGKKEANETFEFCLQRELKEELGIDVEAGELFDVVTHVYAEKTVCLKFLRCHWRRHEPQALGCQAFAWVEREQLDQYKFPAADAQLLQRLRDNPDLWR